MNIVYINSYAFAKPVITSNTFINVWIDNSPTNASTADDLILMRDSFLKQALLPFYNNDEAKYNSNAKTFLFGQYDEDTLTKMASSTQVGLTSATNVISLIFQNETSDYDPTSITTKWATDISSLRSTLASKPRNFYRSVIFEIPYGGDIDFRTIFQKAFGGTSPYTGTNSLSSETDVFKAIYNVPQNNGAKYYANKVIEGLNLFGANLPSIP